MPASRQMLLVWPSIRVSCPSAAVWDDDDDDDDDDGCCCYYTLRQSPSMTPPQQHPLQQRCNSVSQSNDGPGSGFRA